MDILANFGKRVRTLRLAKGISQESLAELSGLHRTYISSVERGKRNVSLNTIQAIARGLDVPIRDLFEDL